MYVKVRNTIIIINMIRGAKVMDYDGLLVEYNGPLETEGVCRITMMPVYWWTTMVY